MHVTCKYRISLLLFNFWVQLSRVTCAHSWDLTCGDTELKTWSPMHICIILEEMHVELVLFHCILLWYPSCLFRQFPTRSKFTDRTQSLTIFSEWLSGLMEKMAKKLNLNTWPTKLQKGMKCVSCLQPNWRSPGRSGGRKTSRVVIAPVWNKIRGLV